MFLFQQMERIVFHNINICKQVNNLYQMKQQNFPCLGGPQRAFSCPKAVICLANLHFALRQIKNPVSTLLAGFSIHRSWNFLFKAILFVCLDIAKYHSCEPPDTDWSGRFWCGSKEEHALKHPDTCIKPKLCWQVPDVLFHLHHFSHPHGSNAPAIDGPCKLGDRKASESF